MVHYHVRGVVLNSKAKSFFDTENGFFFLSSNWKTGKKQWASGMCNCDQNICMFQYVMRNGTKMQIYEKDFAALSYCSRTVWWTGMKWNEWKRDETATNRHIFFFFRSIKIHATDDKKKDKAEYITRTSGACLAPYASIKT